MQLHWSQQSCADLLHMLRWPACSRHAACSNSWAYVFLSTSQQFKEHTKFPWRKKQYSLGQWAITFAAGHCTQWIMPGISRQAKSCWDQWCSKWHHYLKSLFQTKDQDNQHRENTKLIPQDRRQVENNILRNCGHFIVLPFQDRDDNQGAGATCNFCLAHVSYLAGFLFLCHFFPVWVKSKKTTSGA